jgi:hypothetical protein
MKFYDLPDDLIKYIYTFDDNKYYKCIYSNILNDLLNIRSRKIINIYLSEFHNYYDIYKRLTYYPTISSSKYILMSNKTHGPKCISVNDNLNPSYFKNLKIWFEQNEII